MKPHVLYVNVGFWSSTALAEGETEGAVNRKVEALVDSLGGHKSLVQHGFLQRERLLAALSGRCLLAGEAPLRPSR